MSLGAIVLLVYALLMLAGGIVGYAKAGSMPSLVTGIASAVVLVLCWVLARQSAAAGFGLGAVACFALSLFFLYRVRTTGKAMPSGGLLAISVIALVLLLIAAVRAPSA